MFEVTEMLYCSTNVFRECCLIHLEDSPVPVTLERATSVHLELPKVFHRETLLQLAKELVTQTLFSRHYDIINMNSDHH